MICKREDTVAWECVSMLFSWCERTHTLSKIPSCSRLQPLYRRAVSPLDIIVPEQPKASSPHPILKLTAAVIFPPTLSPPPITLLLLTPLALPPLPCTHSTTATYSSNCVGNLYSGASLQQHKPAPQIPPPQSSIHSQTHPRYQLHILLHGTKSTRLHPHISVSPLRIWDTTL